jgi:hypothetical protein
VHVEANDFLSLVRDESVLSEMQAPLDEYMVLHISPRQEMDHETVRRLAVYLGMPVRGSSFAAAHAAHAIGVSPRFSASASFTAVKVGEAGCRQDTAHGRSPLVVAGGLHTCTANSGTPMRMMVRVYR